MTPRKVKYGFEKKNLKPLSFGKKTSPDHKLLRNNTRVRSFDSVGIRVKVKVYELIIA